MDSQPNKKRGSSRQLTKDDQEDNTPEDPNAVGSFPRASEEVLATRRILKARKPASTAAAPAAAPAAASRPGLFAGFSLFQPQARQQEPPKSPRVDTVGDSEAGGGGDERREEAELNPRGRPVPPPPDPEVEEGPPRPAEGGVVEAPDSDDDNDVTSAPRKPVVEDLEVNEKVSRAIEEEEQKHKGKEKEEEEKGEEQKEEEEKGEQEKGEEKDGDKAEGTGKDGEAAAAAAGASSGFAFKGSSEFAKLSSTPNAFSFGSTTPASSPFSFGPTAPTPAPSPAGVPAFPSLSSVFGQSNGSQVNLFGSTAAPTSAAASGVPGTTLASSGSAPPVVTLPAVDVVTGEEEERALLSAEATLFEFAEGGKWKERGKGEVRLNAPDKESRPARLVMRAKGNLRLLLNANLYPGMKLTKMDGRGLSFACVNSAEERSGEAGAPGAALSTLALRLKDPALASELFDLIETHKEHKHEGKDKEPTENTDVEAGHGGGEPGKGDEETVEEKLVDREKDEKHAVETKDEEEEAQEEEQQEGKEEK